MSGVLIEKPPDNLTHGVMCITHTGEKKALKEENTAAVLAKAR